MGVPEPTQEMPISFEKDAIPLLDFEDEPYSMPEAEDALQEDEGQAISDEAWIEGSLPSWVDKPKPRLDPKKIQYYMGPKAFTRLALELDVPPEKQQEVLRRYAKKVVESVFEGIHCPEATGVLMNLDLPTSVEEFKDQLKSLIGKLDITWDLAELDQVDFDVFQNLIIKIRNEVIRLVEQELESRGIGGKVGVRGQLLGGGGFGQVFSCRLGNRNLAAKFRWKFNLTPETKPTYHTYPELIQAAAESENLVSYCGSLDFEGELWDRLDFFEELPGWGSLEDYWSQKEEKEEKEELKRVRPNNYRDYLTYIFLPVLRGVKALHDRHLLHGDIKISNILVSGGKGKPQVKVADYDLVRRSGFNPSGFIMGSGYYLSPEQIEARALTEKTDIFSLGMVLYYSWGGEQEENKYKYLKKVEQGLDVSDLECPERLRHLVEDCLKTEPAERPTINELIKNIEDILIEPALSDVGVIKPFKKGAVESENVYEVLRKAA